MYCTYNLPAQIVRTFIQKRLDDLGDLLGLPLGHFAWFVLSLSGIVFSEGKRPVDDNQRDVHTERGSDASQWRNRRRGD